MNQCKNLLVLDIGGTLCKLCLGSEEKLDFCDSNKLTITMRNQFIYFNYFKRVEECISYIESDLSSNDYEKILVTGGGAYKYRNEIQELARKKSKTVQVLGQFQSLVRGMSFFKKHFKQSQFVRTIFEKNNFIRSNNPNEVISYEELKKPLIITNIGSGVSVFLVDENNEGQLTAERIGGTSLGGGFFLGMANLLTGENDYQNLIKMVETGSQKNIDLIPEDFPKISEELTEASVLVSLAKLDSQSSKQDIVRSLFYMVTFNIAQIALLHSEICGVDNVLFTGFYCRQNKLVLQCFAEAFNFFSKKGNNIKRVYSMKHDGYLGVLGALETMLQ